MSYTPPKNLHLSGDTTGTTPAAGDNDTSFVTSAALQTAVGSATSNRPFAKFRRAAVQAISPVNTPVAISFDTVDTDNSGFRNAATPTRFTAPSDASYVITASVSWASAGTNQQITIYKNGATTGYFQGIIGDTRTLNVSAALDLVAGDYIEIFAQTGVLMNVTAAVCSIAFTGGTGAAWGNAGCRAFNSGVLSIATSGTAQVVPFDSESFDIDGMHVTSGNTSRLTCVTAGTYVITGNVEWASSATGLRELQVRINGTATTIAVDKRTAVSGETMQQGVTCVYQLAAGDYVDLYARQTSGGALNIQNQWFSAVRVGYQTNPNKNGGFLGRNTATANITAASLANAAISAGTPVLGHVVQGDGVNYIKLELAGYAPFISAGTAGHFNIGIYDSTSGVWIAKQQFYCSATGISAGGLNVVGFIAPFTGSKTFQLVFENVTGGTSTIQMQALSTYPTYLTSEWAGSTGHA